MNNYRSNRKNRFKSNGDRQKFGSNFSNNENFKRKAPGRNNHNAPKLIEKYNDLAREASSNGDKILSENYLQHADHFTRVLNERESVRRERFSDNKNDDQANQSEEAKIQNEEISKSNIVNEAKKENEEEKVPETQA